MQHVGPHLEGRHLKERKHRAAKRVEVAHVRVAPPAGARAAVRVDEGANARGGGNDGGVVTRGGGALEEGHAEEGVDHHEQEADVRDARDLGQRAAERVDDLPHVLEALDEDERPQRAQGADDAHELQLREGGDEERRQRRADDGRVEQVPAALEVSLRPGVEAIDKDLEHELRCEERREDPVAHQEDDGTQRAGRLPLGALARQGDAREHDGQLHDRLKLLPLDHLARAALRLLVEGRLARLGFAQDGLVADAVQVQAEQRLEAWPVLLDDLGDPVEHLHLLVDVAQRADVLLRHRLQLRHRREGAALVIVAVVVVIVVHGGRLHELQRQQLLVRIGARGVGRVSGGWREVPPPRLKVRVARADKVMVAHVGDAQRLPLVLRKLHLVHPRQLGLGLQRVRQRRARDLVALVGFLAANVIPRAAGRERLGQVPLDGLRRLLRRHARARVRQHRVHAVDHSLKGDRQRAELGRRVARHGDDLAHALDVLVEGVVHRGERVHRRLGEAEDRDLDLLL
mmetsp:Transcript_54846/g.145374  ORF Transcript_54846/g.145374 Transcript_54846/m.145374 type:complete len:515 (-) Transcript_54846:718-2262(-)